MNGKEYFIIVIIFGVALIAGSLSAYQYYEGIQKDKESKALNDELIATQAKIIEQQEISGLKADQLALANADNFKLSQELNSKSNEIINSNNDLIVANAKLITFQEETIKKILGSGHILIHQNTIEPQNFQINAVNNGDYPIYDINVIIYKEDEIMKLPFKERDGKIWVEENSYRKFQTQLQNFDLGSGNIMNLSFKEAIPSHQFKYLFKVICRNITTFQYTIFVYDADKNTWHNFYRIYQINTKGDTNSRFGKLLAESGNLPEDYYIRNFHFLKDIGTVQNLNQIK